MSPIVRRRPDSPRPTLNHPQKRVRPLQPPSEKGQTPSSPGQPSTTLRKGSDPFLGKGSDPFFFLALLRRGFGCRVETWRAAARIDEGGPMLQRLRPRSAYDLVALL